MKEFMRQLLSLAVASTLICGPALAAPRPSPQDPPKENTQQQPPPPPAQTQKPAADKPIDQPDSVTPKNSK